MAQIVLNVENEQKANLLLSLFHDLDYVEVETKSSEKVWLGDLPVLKKPISVPDFKMYSKEELYER
jgi:hypothetical protein